MRLWIGFTTALVIGFAIYCYLPASSELELDGAEIESAPDDGHKYGLNAYMDCSTTLPNYPSITDYVGDIGCYYIEPFPAGQNGTWILYRQQVSPTLTLRFTEYGQASGTLWIYDLTLKYRIRMPGQPSFSRFYECYGSNFTVVWVPPTLLTSPPPPTTTDWPSYKLHYNYSINSPRTYTIADRIVPADRTSVGECVGNLDVFFEPTSVGAFGCTGFGKDANFTWTLDTGGLELRLPGMISWAKSTDAYSVIAYSGTLIDPSKIIDPKVGKATGGQAIVNFLAYKNSTLPTDGFQATFVHLLGE